MRNYLSSALALSLWSFPLLAQGPVRATSFSNIRWQALESAAASGTSSQAAPSEVKAWEVAATLGVIAGVSLLDDQVRDYTQNHRTAGKDNAAKLFRHMGQPEVYATVGLGTLAVGLVSGDDGVRRAGGRITAALLTSGVVNSVIKVLVGRRRPNSAVDPYEFTPLSKNVAFPSGHTAMAFALAASVSDEINSWPATVGLYGVAGLTGWSRINDNKHWLSDVLGGATVGITSAKLMDGKWRVLGASQPHFLASPHGVAMTMSATF